MHTYQSAATKHFAKRIKKLCKKYPNLHEDIVRCVRAFDKRSAAYLGRGVYKLRLKSSDIPKGKNKSFRLIVLLMEVDNLIVPLTVYFKGDSDDISPQEVELHVEAVLSELRFGY